MNMVMRVEGTSVTDPEGDGERDTLPLQPRPIGLTVITIEDCGLTVIKRQWAPGDPARCRLCPRGKCGADSFDSCVVVARRPVDRASTGLYSVSTVG